MLKIEDRCVGCPAGVPCLGAACPNRDIPVWYCDECGQELERWQLRRLNGNELCFDCFGEEAWDSAEEPEG